MDNYITAASEDIKEFCDRIAKNENVRNQNNDLMINQEQQNLIKNIELKLKAMKKSL
jgi:hypothetical protein